MTSSISLPGIRSQRTPQRAYHARRHGRLKSIRVADRDHKLPYAKLLRIAERSGSDHWLIDSRLIYANHRQIARRIVSDSRRWHAASVGQRHLDASSIMHDVAVGENQPVGSEYKTRPSAAPFARLPERVRPAA